MKELDVSNGRTVFFQVLILAFFIAFGVLVGSTVIKNPTQGGILFLAFTILITSAILKGVCSLSDIVIREDFILIQNLFGTKRVQRSSFSKVESTFLPFIFRIRLHGGRAVLFTPKDSLLLKHLFRSDPKVILRELVDLIETGIRT